MAAEPPAPKTHFQILPAKPKGTLADYDAGNLAPPAATKETTVPHGRAPLSKTRRRRPNPPKFAEKSTAELQRAVRIAEEIEVPPRNAFEGQPPPWQRVLDDLLDKRNQIDAAINALRELYE